MRCSPGPATPIVVRLFGDDLEALRAKADEVAGAPREHRRRGRAARGAPGRHPADPVDVDLVKAERYGLKPGDVRRAAATLLASEEVGDIFRDGKAYDVHVFSTPASRNSLSDVKERCRSTRPVGGTRRCRTWPTCASSRRPTRSRVRTSHERSTSVPTWKAATSARSSRSCSSDLQAVDFPLGVHAEVLGEFAERQAAQPRLFLFAAVGRDRRSS